MTPSDRSILWELCFGDAPDVAESFFEIPDVISVAEYSEDTLIGMASLVPVHTASGLSGYYAYGVCTHPSYRGHGVFTRLMERCERQAIKEGLDFLCLIPATPRLTDTYSRMGYSKKIALFDAPDRSGDAIYSSSRGFLEFATPDSGTPPLLTDDRGAMKPLSDRARRHEFYFAAPMGER